MALNTRKSASSRTSARRQAAMCASGRHPCEIRSLIQVRNRAHPKKWRKKLCGYGKSVDNHGSRIGLARSRVGDAADATQGESAQATIVHAKHCLPRGGTRCWRLFPSDIRRDVPHVRRFVWARVAATELSPSCTEAGSIPAPDFGCGALISEEITMAGNFRLSPQLRITASFGMALAIAAALCAIDASAQQAGTNVNVLPVLTDQNGNVITPAMDPDAHLKGDYYLQRQVEPSIAVSTRNPSHVVAFFNDYRAVDIPLDSGLGQTARAKTGFLGRFAGWLFRRPSTTPNVPPPTVVAAAEAWVGMARSYDNGLTWSGALVPGAPFDLSPELLRARSTGWKPRPTRWSHRHRADCSMSCLSVLRARVRARWSSRVTRI